MRPVRAVRLEVDIDRADFAAACVLRTVDLQIQRVAVHELDREHRVRGLDEE